MMMMMMMAMTVPYAACIQLCPPEDEYLMLETCRSVIICEIIVCICCVTWHGIDYKLPEDDTIVSKHVGVG